MISVAPCKDCDKRTVGCHGGCELYQRWSSARQEMLDKRNAETAKTDMADDYIIARAIKRRRQSNLY